MKTAIYGAGHHGEIFYNIISKHEKIDFFIDKYKCNQVINNMKVYDLDIPKNTKVYNSLIFHEAEVINELNCSQLTSYIDTLHKYPEIITELHTSSFLWLAGDLLHEDLKNVRKLLKDEISLTFFDKWVEFRKTFNMKHYPSQTHSQQDQYFLEGFKFSKRFIDAGAFNGDTVGHYYKHNDGEVISFEPDPKNLKALACFSKGKNVLIYPLGVSDKTELLKFRKSGSSSSFCDEGDDFLAVTSLDETVYNFMPDYIKMDIEGSEYKALLGSQKIIKDFTPNLAICIYHKAEDLWKIPLLINEINPNYTFKIRSHGPLATEVVLYCTKKL